MSGYLTSLVRRAMAPELSVRPRLPSMFGPPAPGPQLDIPTPVGEDEGVEQTIDRALRPEKAASTPQVAASPSAAAEPPMPEAATPARPLAPPRSERLPTRSARPDVTAETDRPSQQQADQPRDAPGVPSEQKTAVEPHRPIRDAVEPDPVQQKRSVPAPPRLLAARTLDEHPIEPSSTRIAGPVVSPDSTGVNEVAKSDRDHPVPNTPADRPSTPQPSDRVDPALRVTRAEVTSQDAKSPHKVEHDRNDEHRADAAAPAPTREPSDTMREPIPVRSRVIVPRRDESRAERSAAPDPIIQVTIGRVEVRASTSPEPRPKPRPANGAGSLGDYLRQRSGRSRP